MELVLFVILAFITTFSIAIYGASIVEEKS